MKKISVPKTVYNAIKKSASGVVPNYIVSIPSDERKGPVLDTVRSAPKNERVRKLPDRNMPNNERRNRVDFGKFKNRKKT